MFPLSHLYINRALYVGEYIFLQSEAFGSLLYFTAVYTWGHVFGHWLLIFLPPASSFSYPICELCPFSPLSNLQSFQTIILKILLLFSHLSVHTTLWFLTAFYTAGHSAFSWLIYTTQRILLDSSIHSHMPFTMLHCWHFSISCSSEISSPPHLLINILLPLIFLFICLNLNFSMATTFLIGF